MFTILEHDGPNAKRIQADKADISILKKKGWISCGERDDQQNPPVFIAVRQDLWEKIEDFVINDEEEEDDLGDDEIPAHEEGVADYVCEVAVTDPDSKGTVVLAVFKDRRTGGMFALDASWIEQSDELEERGDAIASPFEEEVNLILTGID